MVLATDFTVTNSAAFVTATGMSVTLAPGTWLIQSFVVFNDSDATQGHKVQFDFGGVSCNNATSIVSGNSTGLATMQNPWPGSGTVSNSSLSHGAGLQFGGGNLTCLVVIPSTAVMSLQMAQAAAAGGTSAVMKAGSYMTAQRVA